MRTPHRYRVRGPVLLLSSALAAGLTLAGGPAALADEDVPAAPSVFRGRIDVDDPDLKLPEGKTLAAPKVLDIKTVVGDERGTEQREDSNSDVKFQLQAEVLFGKDSAELSDVANDRIGQIADEIEKQHATTVTVAGFTDDLGSSAHGLKLSKRRADAVQRELNEDLDGSGITFEIRGYGEDAPVASNDTEDGRKKNRRVEVSFPRAE
ncbi:OmpA family protein [Streptomyces ochraceiscleroticus]|uniref:OmpA family protein n=1 Tax=Streptomyces ochraceiscleroticus TaxID=47761 RepID=A0ABW1MGC5_9ACTN|nr:OmpA family protein [Streptomyces ochraceiscleroticus]